ncbi:MAG: methyl-accepting chemotaxis protein [Bdellovibrionaceae bacterium]|nr:methyl-accepting chemotaxis protein [Pseudobdellovibrionaceae bacterium]
MKNLSLRVKLYALSGFLLAVSLVLGGIGFWSTTAISRDYSDVTTVNMPNIENVNKMLVYLRQARIELLHVAMPDMSRELAEKSISEIDHQMSSLNETLAAYEALPMGPGEQEMINDFKAKLTKQQGYFGKAVALYRKGVDKDSPERAEMRALLVGELRDNAREVREAGDRLHVYHEKWAAENVANAESTASRGNTLSLLTLLCGFLCGAAFAYLFSNSLVKTLDHITTAISEASTQVSAAASQIASSSEELSQAATEQAASLEETAASIEEMNSMVGKNRENAKNTAGMSSDSEHTASKGREVVDQMIASMNEINRSNEQIGEIVKVINEIGNKTKVINDIVFQTKLLSFNASVEAARAGEHGKGFAVVAEEVGNLAQMSGNAAKEISGLLESSIQRVEAIVQETKAKVESGALTARQCGEILGEIVTNVSKVAVMASEISTASEEQARGVQEITKAMNQLDQVTQTNAATSEEAASAAEELSAQAGALKSLVVELHQTVAGGGEPTEVSSVGSSFEKPKAVRPVASSADKKGKVVHLKNRSTSESSPAPVAFKRASGESTPDYDDSRFKDV